MRVRRLWAASTSAVLSAALLAGVGPATTASAAAPVAVTVNARAGLATMPATGLGTNHAIWDTALGSDQTADLLKAAGVRMLRYPGGSYGDIYHWESHTAPGGFVAANTDFDTFMAGVRRTGAEPMIIANYGTGTPAEAAGWVRYANVTKQYGAKYWAIGNENYGNGHYGASWEADDHEDKSATGYADLVVQYADAMKAVDPTIKIGAVLTMPANWPDAIKAGSDPGSWNQTVLSIAGSKIDFVDLHWYPGGATAEESLGKTQQIEDAIYLARRQIAQYVPDRADRIGMSFTELNVDVGRNTQPGALFLADSYSRLLAAGAFTVQWWNVHNGIGTPSVVAGQQDYQDFGLLSSGNCTADGSVCQPPFNTPFAPYHALSMMNLFTQPGDQFVRAGTSNPKVIAHAVRRRNGALSVLLINEDPDNAQPVTIAYQGYQPSPATYTVHTYVNGGGAVTTSQSSTPTSHTLPPYSLTTLVLKPTGPAEGIPGTPGQPAVSAVTDSTATISWPASTGTLPVGKYEVYRHVGTVSQQLGETTGTSFNVANLTPATRYTVNVLARDNAGKVSWASTPVTFYTGTPATSSCTVRFTDNGDWGNGYIAGVDITNNGDPINSWTLAYSWPNSWQSMNGGWNANWTQTGREVTATNVDWNGRLEKGATISIGFVAGYSGPNILPPAFTLNGVLCHTAG